MTFWVGGLWLLYFVFMPALEHYGLAPLLRQELGEKLLRIMLGFAAVCMLLQLLVLLAGRGQRLLADLRMQALLAGLLLVGGFFLGPWLGLESRNWALFCYLATAACGLVLLLQPEPGRSD